MTIASFIMDVPTQLATVLVEKITEHWFMRRLHTDLVRMFSTLQVTPH